MSAGKSLTEPPQNLKEAVDWVLCMSGNDGEGDYNKGQEAIKKLATQVKTLLSGVSVPGVTVGLEQLFQGDTIGSFGSNASIASLASGLNALIDQTNGMGNRYAYTYKKDDSSQTVNDEKSAKMFLGMIPLLFFGLGFLFYMCRRDGGKWSVTKLSAGPFRVFLDAVGFNIDQLNGGKTGYDAVSSGLANFDEFRNLDSLPKTFREYLQNVKQKSEPQFQFSPNYYPVYTLYVIAYHYFKKQDGSLSIDKLPQDVDGGATLLKQLGNAVKSLDSVTSTKLSSAYDNLSEAITNALNTPDPVGESSVVGPVSGTLPLPGCSVPDRPCTSTSAAPVHF